MSKRHFTLLEMMAALAVFMICIDLVLQVVLQSHKAFAHNDSRFTVSLVMENILEELDPKSYSIEELEDILKEENELNEMTKKGITWKVEKVEGKASIQFIHKERVVFKTLLELP